MRRWLRVSGGAVALAVLTGGTPAFAKKPKPAPIVVAPAPLPPIPGIDSASLAAVDRFNASRPGARLWLSGPKLSPGGAALLARLRTSTFDGYVRGPALAARIDADLARGDAADADRALSGGYVMLARLLTGPLPTLHYMEPGARPIADTPEHLLAMAALAPNLEAQIGSAFRRSQIYADLRAAAVADAASRGGAPDPRLLANLERARAIPPSGKVVVVNPAAQELWMVENGQVADRMKVVVGKVETPTAPMVSVLHYITLNPYWNVPSDLVRKIVAPRAARMGLPYIKRGHYEVVDQFGPDATVLPASSVDWKAVIAGDVKVQLRQQPGPFNSMGRMKFAFTNDRGIYLHDSPSRGLFADPVRVESNGCVRLEDAPRLARWLMGTVPSPTGPGGDQSVPLPSAVPLYIAYLTAQPTGTSVEWADDIYHLDPAAPLATPTFATPAPTLATGG